MAKKYKSSIDEDKKLGTTVGIIFNKDLITRINEYAKLHDLTDYSFSSVVRELIEKGLKEDKES